MRTISVLRVAAAAFVVFLTIAPGARAATINYVFEPGTTITAEEANSPFTNYTEQITGSFTFNTSNDTISAVDVTLSGSPSYFAPNPITFLYAFSAFNFGNQEFGFAYAGTDDNSSYLIALDFGGLGGTSSPLYGGAFYNGQGNNNAFARSASGGVEVSTTPLPAALPLFAGGLGVIGLLARRKKKAAAALAAA